MSQRPFQFLHAADLHLDEPASGLVDAPEHLVDLLIDCPLRAAKRVFDAAIEHRVDFVVLAGDIVDVRRASPREVTFLVEQFQRLSQRNIAVYWAGGEIDSADWPSHLTLPGNVKHASRMHVQRHRHEVAGAPVCELVGRSHDQGQPANMTEFANSRDDLFSIAVAHAEFANGLGNLGIQYWALGGSHRRSTPHQSQKSIAHDPGTPQGRRSSEAGPHGCTLVQVDERGEIRLTPIATDVVRFESQKLTLGLAADRAEFERMLRDQTAQLITDAGAATLLLEWTIECEGALFAELRRGKLAADLLDTLNREFGNKPSAAWAVAMQPSLHGDLPAAWLREETLRGDYLRAVAELTAGTNSADDAALVKIGKLLDRHEATAAVRKFDRLASLDDREGRLSVLRQAAWLGADLLSPEEAVR